MAVGDDLRATFQLTVVVSQYADSDRRAELAKLLGLIEGVIAIEPGPFLDVKQRVATRKAVRTVSALLDEHLGRLTDKDIDELTKSEDRRF